MDYACNTRANNGGGGGGFSEDLFGDDAVVRLRGLPYDAGKMQIAEFFKGEIEYLYLLIITDIRKSFSRNISYFYSFKGTF